jgi:hypothetical protein
MRRRLLPGLAALAVVAVLAPAGAASSAWIHWQGRHFTCWIPDRHWQVVESDNGLDISSPTGLAEVSFAYATNGPSNYGIGQIVGILLSPQAGIANARILGHGAVYRTGGGGAGQVVTFTGVRVRDRTLVRGILRVEVFGNAFDAYEQRAPARQWAAWAPTLAAVQNHITFYGRG